MAIHSSPLIQVLPVDLRDFDTMRQFVDSKDGTLSGVTIDHSTAVTNDEDAAIRNEWSLQQQRDIFENDKTAHFVKAVDTDDGNKILSIAHWHYYPAGYVPSDLQYAGLKNRNEDASYPRTTNVPMYKAIQDAMINERNNWTGNGPQWVLASIKTRLPARGQGAGGALVQWGVDKAKVDGCPAFLEADPSGVSLYQKHGFVAVGDIPVDLRPHGIPATLTIQKMVANK